ncbi:MAG: zinc-binding dehydrogenase [Microbacterium arborescens]
MPLFDDDERSLPSGTGYDFAGTVVLTGRGVAAWRPGVSACSPCSSPRARERACSARPRRATTLCCAASASSRSPTAIADYPARTTHAVAGVGGADAGVSELDHLVQLIARGEVELPIDSTYPLDEVRRAYTRSMIGRAAGKIVVLPRADG